jgi:hypothetical protein
MQIETIALAISLATVQSEPSVWEATMFLRPVVLAVIVLTAAGAAHAASRVPGTPLSECVQLGGNHESMRFGQQYLLIKNDEAYYRLSFNGDCAALGFSLDISTDGQANRLCPSGTRVSSARDACAVRSVDAIDAAGFEHYRKRSH